MEEAAAEAADAGDDDAAGAGDSGGGPVKKKKKKKRRKRSGGGGGGGTEETALADVMFPENDLVEGGVLGAVLDHHRMVGGLLLVQKRLVRRPCTKSTYHATSRYTVDTQRPCHSPAYQRPRTLPRFAFLAEYRLTCTIFKTFACTLQNSPPPLPALCTRKRVALAQFIDEASRHQRIGMRGFFAIVSRRQWTPPNSVR